MGKIRVWAVAIAIAVMAVAVPASAHALAANDGCVSCHSPGGVAANQPPFRGVGVDYNKCVSCHWPGGTSGVGGSFYHVGHYSNDCGSCHTAFMGGRSADPTRLQQYATPYGWFNSAASLTKTPAELHAIHNSDSWPVLIAGVYPSSCRSCHQAASCGGCHNDPDPPGTPQTHTDHTLSPLTGVYASPPVTRTVGLGTPVGFGTLTQVAEERSTCVNDACHSLALSSQPSFEPSCTAACHADKTSAHGYDTARHTTSQDIVGCAGATCHATTDLMGAHTAKNALFTCAGCHRSARAEVVSAIVAHDTRCDACHGTLGSGYHSAIATTHAGFDAATCAGAGCHPGPDVTAVHARFVGPGSRYPQYADTCALCHRNADPARITWATTKSGACANCHPAVPHAGARHVAASTVSAGCVACHETNVVTTVHGATAITPANGTRCATCHDNTLRGDLARGRTVSDCEGCHGGLVPYDPNHYVEATHTVAASAGCDGCHYASMKTEHAKPTVAPAVTCVSCHESRVDSFTVSWDRTCTACHAVKHAGMALAHASSKTACGGSGCHAIADVSAIHDTPRQLANGCPICHTGRDTLPTGKTDCSASGCHATVTSSHDAAHDASAVVDPGCAGCHYLFINTEHAKLGYTCATCHDSTVTAVATAIRTHQRACSACHPAVNGRDRHAAQSTLELIPENASGHRVTSALPWARTSYKVGTSTYAWPLPSSFLKTGWSPTSVVTCRDCHAFASAAAGPHGASVAVNMDPAWSGDYHTAYLTSSGTSISNLICAKCHTNFTSMNKVHNTGDHHSASNGKCVSCHAGVPHGWRLPRLLAYTTDPAPYRTITGGITQVSLRSHSSPSDWSSTDCYAGCAGDHSHQVSNVWPSKVEINGSLSGVVTDAGGAALGGATVAVTGQGSAVTAASGAYSFASLPAGTYDVTVSLTGYVSQTRSVTIVGRQAASLSFALIRDAGTLTGRVTDGSGAGLSGVAVAVTGDGSTVTDASGYYTLSTVPSGTRSVTYSKTGYDARTVSVTMTAGGTITSNVTLALTPVYANLARGRSATASRYSSGYEPARAFDGSTSTRWASGDDNTQWLRVDLGSAESVDKVVIGWYSGYYAKSYRVQCSSDGSSWSDVYSTSDGNSGTKTVTFSSRSARYWRIYATSANSSSGYSITELEVWGR